MLTGCCGHTLTLTELTSTLSRKLQTAPLQKWAPSGRMLVDDRFGLEKFTEGNLSPFTSISRHLVASERGLRIFRRAINKHHPRLKSGGHVIRAFLAC